MGKILGYKNFKKAKKKFYRKFTKMKIPTYSGDKILS
jgi:hypothetical protein